MTVKGIGVGEFISQLVCLLKNKADVFINFIRGYWKVNIWCSERSSDSVKNSLQEERKSYVCFMRVRMNDQQLDVKQTWSKQSL